MAGCTIVFYASISDQEYLRQCLRSCDERIAFLKGRIEKHTAVGYTFHMLSHFERHLYYASGGKKWVQCYLDHLLEKEDSGNRGWVESDEGELHRPIANK
jgi:hypothetical protein